MTTIRTIEQPVKVVIDEDQLIADSLTGELKALQARMRAMRAQEQALIDERLVLLRRINGRRRTSPIDTTATERQVVDL